MEVVIISCSCDKTNTVSIWNPFNATLLSSYHGGGDCSPHSLEAIGGYIIANETNKPMLHAWALNKQHFINKRLITPGKIKCFAISPDTNYIAVGVESKLHVYQTASGRRCGISSQHIQSLVVIKFNDEGTLIGCGGEDGLFSVWSLSDFVQRGLLSPVPLYMVHSHSLPITDFFFTAGDLVSRFVTCSLDHTCQMYDLASKKKLYACVFEFQLTALSLSPSESCFFVGDSGGYIREVSLTNPPREIENHCDQKNEEGMKIHEKGVTSLSCSLDCSLLISGSLDETVKLTHIKSKQCLQTILLKGPVTNCFFYVPPHNMLSNSFKPSFEFYDFVNNNEGLDYFSFEVANVEDLITDFDEQQKKQEPSIGVMETSNSSEIDKLKIINHELYSYAVKSVLKNSHVHQGNLENEEQTSLPVNKKKRKR